MKFLKTEKGIYGYINRQMVIEILKTVFMFACAAGLYLIGYLTLKTNKSIWTVIAVLSVLPASKSAVNMIMFLRFKSLNVSDYEKISSACGNIKTRYEYVFTTSETSYYVKSAACCDNTVIVLLDDNSGKTARSNELKKHITSSMDREGLTGYSLKVYTGIDEYVSRLAEMDRNLDGLKDESYAYIFALFNAVTL